MNVEVQLRTRTPILALLAANTVSQVGNVFALVAIPWFVFQTTGSAAKMGLTGFFSVLPVVLAGFFGGALIDRIGHRRSSIIADLLSGLSVVAIPLLYFTVGLSFWQLVTLVFLGALLDMPGSTARQSLVPDLAQLADMRLERINAAYQTIQQTSFLIGPTLAGFLIAIVGPANVLWLNAASFAVSAGLIAVAVPRVQIKSEGSPEPSRGYLAEVVEGWAFIVRERVIFALTVANAVGNFLTAPLFAVVLPIYASEALGSSVDLGLMVGGVAAGSLVGAVLYGLAGNQVPRRWVYTGGWVVGTLPFWVLAGTPPLVITLSGLVILGLANGPVNPLMHTLSQERTPRHLRGRVFSARIALANVAAPLGILFVGFMVEFAGLRTTVILIAAAHSLAALGVVFHGAFRELDSTETSASHLPGTRGQSRRTLEPHFGMLAVGGILLLIGLGIAGFVTDGRSAMSITGIAIFIAGWILCGAGLRPFGSIRIGASVATGLYGLVGLAVAVVSLIPQPAAPVSEFVPTTETVPTLLLFALLWPLVMIGLGRRSLRSG